MEHKIKVETSARHLHVSQEHLEILFGEGHALTVKKMLSQPGQFACEERIDMVGPKGKLKLSILGPVRPETQVELSLTDARTVGIAAPIRESGDISDTPGCVLEGPKGSVTLTQGVIAAKRHIHTTPEDAKELGVSDKEEVMLEINTGARSVIFKQVIVRVNEQYATAAHIDTDEANAIAPDGEVYGVIVK